MPGPNDTEPDDDAWSDPGDDVESETTEDIDHSSSDPNVEQEPVADEPSDPQASSSERQAPGPDEQFCSSCGAVIKKNAEICPDCGVRQGSSQTGQQPQQPLKNPGIAAIASFFFAGLGQIYNGQFAKGLLLMLVQFINVGLMFVLVGFLTYPIVWIYGVYDAYKTAEKINEGEVVT